MEYLSLSNHFYTDIEIRILDHPVFIFPYSLCRHDPEKIATETTGNVWNRTSRSNYND